MSRVPPKSTISVAAERLVAALGLGECDPASTWSTGCPGCRTGTLTLYQDTAGGGHWQHCPACGGGTLLDLAAAVWGDTTRGAVEKCRRLGLLAAEPTAAAVDAYCRARDRRRAVDAFWRTAAAALPFAEDDPAGLRDEFDAADARRWPGRGGRLFGAASREALAALLGKGVAKLFPTLSRWRSAWLTPVCDLPGRVVGFVVLAGGEAAAVGADGGPPPAGFVAVDGLTGAAPRVAVVCDPLLAVRLQVGHLARAGNAAAAPVAGVWAAGPAGPLPVPRPATVWAAAASPDAVRHARRADGRLAVGGDPLGAARKFGVAAWLAAADRDAKPWPAAFATVAAAMTPGEIAAAALTAADWAAVGETGAVGRPPAAAQPAPRPTVVLTGQEVVERDGGWALAATGERIADATVRLDEVVYRDSPSKPYYRGVATYRGVAHPFSAPKAAFDRDAFAWLTGHLMAAGASPLPYFHPRWGRLGAALAALFHPPVVVRGTAQFGWDGANRQFVFPRFTVAADGTVADVPAPGRTLKLPGASLVRPRPVPAAALSALGDCPLAWAVLIAVLHNLSAPARRTRPRTIAGDWPEAAVRRLALAFGCVSPPDPEGNAPSPAVVTEFGRHGWPVLVDCRLTARWTQWLDGRRNCLYLPPSRLTALLVKASGGVAIRCRAATVDDATAAAAAVALPACLAWWTGRGGFNRASKKDRRGVRGTAKAVRGWWASVGGDPAQVWAGGKMLARSGHASDIGAAAATAYDQGWVGWARTDCPVVPDKPAVLFDPAARTVRLPRNLGEAFSLHGYPTPSPERIEALLQAAGLLRATTPEGWTVDDAWWGAALAASRARPVDLGPRPVRTHHRR